MKTENINENAVEMEELDEMELGEVTGGAARNSDYSREQRARDQVRRKRCMKDTGCCLTAGSAPYKRNGVTIGIVGKCPRCGKWTGFKVLTSGALGNDPVGYAANYRNIAF